MKKQFTLIISLIISLTLCGTTFAATINSTKTTPDTFSSSLYSGKIKSSYGNSVNIEKIKPYISRVYYTQSKTTLTKSTVQSNQTNNENKIHTVSQFLASLHSTLNYGSAWAYISESTTEINCYGYASKFNSFLNPGDICYNYKSPISDGGTPDVDKVASYVLKDMQKVNRPSRIISSPSAHVNPDEYRVALRVGEQQDMYDYHFMLQCSDGGWCTKAGQTPSEYLGMINPSNYSWDLGPIKNFYNSKTVYFAIKK